MLNIDLGRFFKDVSDIATGLRAGDWNKVFTAMADILAMLAGQPATSLMMLYGAATTATASGSVLTPACKALLQPEKLTIAEIADNLDALVADGKAGTVQLGPILSILIKLFQALLAIFGGGVTP